jgi:hypothetical protein
MSKRRFLDHELLNQLTDASALWGPLLFLRPKQHQVLSAGRLLTVCSLFSGFYGMCGNVLISLARYGANRPLLPVYLLPLLLTAFTFLCGQFTVARAWNTRARRMARKIDWTVAAGRSPADPSGPELDGP